ncbi:MAG: DegV family protein [Candidatus Limivicinus sp.]
MNKPVIITADSTCDLSDELVEKYNIKIIPLTITLGDESFLDGRDFTPDVMYRRFRADGTLPKTAAPSIQQYADFFGSLVKAGYEVVHLNISAELSGSFNNAHIAASEFEGVYPIDTRTLSTGIGILALEGSECSEKGMSGAEIYEHLMSLVPHVDISFVLDTLEFMWKGGRCTGVVALGANLLRLKPALEMRDGKLEVYKKYRGSIDGVYKQYIIERLKGKKVRPGHIFITHSGEVPDSKIEELKELVNSLVPNMQLHVTVAGCTVSSHCGPKTLGVLFITE